MALNWLKICGFLREDGRAPALRVKSYNLPRDRYLGWDAPTRMHRLPGVVNNVRFLILPGVHIPNLASRILAANLRRLGGDWQRPYGRPVFLAETFVDAARFRGTCYRASNWLYLGDTRGFSRRGAHYTPNGAPKRVFAPGRNVAVAGERSPPAPDQEGIKLLRRRLFALTVVGITGYTHDHEDYHLDPRRALPPD